MTRRRIAVLGSTGQLGTDLVDVLQSDERFEPLPLSHSECDCTNAFQVTAVIQDLHPDVVINCAAYVRVDDCEDHPEEAFRVNAIGALNVARACAEVSALCVYMSTDYVFDGTKGAPYTESDEPRPINVYGTSKLAGEHLVRQTAARSLIVRMASLFGKTGARGKGGNFVETIISRAKAGETLRITNDMQMSPTYTRDAAAALLALLQCDSIGIFHVVNGGVCSWYEFAKAILERLGLANDTIPISSEEYRAKARRPKDSSLRCEKIQKVVRYQLPFWQDALTAYLVEKGYKREHEMPAGVV